MLYDTDTPPQYYQTPIPEIYILDLDNFGYQYLERIQILVSSLYGMDHSSTFVVANRLFHDTTLQICDILDCPEERFMSELLNLPNFNRYADIDMLFNFETSRKVLVKHLREFAVNLFFKLREAIPLNHEKYVQLVSISSMHIHLAVYNASEV